MSENVNQNENQEMQEGNVVPLETKEPKKPSIFKRAASKIGAGIRQVWESPVACAIGAGVGALATLGVQAWLAHKSSGLIDIPEGDVTDLGDSVLEETEEVVNE